MVFDANIDAKGDRTDHSIHHTVVYPRLLTQQIDIRNPGYRGCDPRYSYSGMDLPP
jgi:hypothetical protein